MSEHEAEPTPNLGMLRRTAATVVFTDQYGDRRIIHRSRGTKLAVKRLGNTPAHAMNRAAAVLIGKTIKAYREQAGLTLEELCQRAGLVAGVGQGKMRMYEIENATRQQGVRTGTLYAIAVALDVPIQAFLPTNEEIMAAAGVEFAWSEGLSA